MGTRCLTDGRWVWPEGLAHYIEVHHVRLPEEYVEVMKQNDWKIPELEIWPTLGSQGDPDYTFWIKWGQATDRIGPASCSERCV